jgi:hypothetical protein
VSIDQHGRQWPVILHPEKRKVSGQLRNESDPAARLRKLQELRDSDLLTQDEYEPKRAEVIRLI